MPFDILTDSALDITRGLLKEAWGGQEPIGGLDFPSACTLSKASEDNSDLHVELVAVQNAPVLSDIPWLADVTYTEVQGPADTDSPLRFAAGEATPPGIFGKALKAYGTVIALCQEYGLDTTNYDRWFRAQWGVDPKADLAMAIPVVRSHGDAMWGGLARKLAPSSLALPAASKQVKVVWHGTERSKFGEHKLVDWPRLSAIARTAGTALLLEDRIAAGKVRRIDFKIVGREIPVAPQFIGRAIEHIAAPETWEVRDISRGALEYIAGFRKHALILARAGFGTDLAFTSDGGDNIPTSSLIKFLAAPKIRDVPRIDLSLMEEPDFEIVDKKPKVPQFTEEEKHAPFNIFSAVGSAIRPAVERNFSALPPAYIVRSTILALDSYKKDEVLAAVDKLRHIVDIAVPDDFLIRIFRMYGILHRSREKGGEMVVAILKAMRVSHGVFDTKDLLAVGVRAKNDNRGLTWLGDEVAKAINRNIQEKGTEAPLAGVLRKILSTAASTDLALHEIVRRRRNWWANEYFRRSKYRDNKRIIYQIKARLFRVVKVSSTIENGVMIEGDDPVMRTVLYDIATGFLRKRKKHGTTDPQAPDPNYSTTRGYCRALDLELKPDVLFQDAWDDFLRSAQFLADDIIAIIDYAAQDTPLHVHDIPSELDDGLITDKDIAPGFTKGFYDEPDIEEKPVIHAGLTAMMGLKFADSDSEDEKEEEKPSGGMFGSGFGGFNDDDDSDDVVDTAGKIELATELYEDVPGLTPREIADAVNEHGDFVTIPEYNLIVEDVRKKNLLASSGKKNGSNEGGYDISDRY